MGVAKNFVLLSVVLASIGVPRAFSQKVTITITRQSSDKRCVTGQLALNGEIIGYTLERPAEGNIPLISSIPAGTYRAYVRTETNDRWRIELLEVPHRGNVQIHIGNTLENTIGCIILGEDLGSGACTVRESRKAFDGFKLAFAKASGGAADKDVSIRVSISGT